MESNLPGYLKEILNVDHHNKFYDTLRRLRLGAPIDNIQDYIVDTVAHELELFRCPTKIILSQEYHDKFCKQLGATGSSLKITRFTTDAGPLDIVVDPNETSIRVV